MALFNPRNRALRAADVEALLSRFLSGDAARPQDVALYQRAMVHRSYAAAPEARLRRINEQCPAGCMPLQPVPYERLEFLGDAVLSLATARYLYDRYPSEDEGFLTRMRTSLTNGRMLARLCARHTALPAFVVTAARGAPPGRPDESVLEDVLEAFLGALYLDRGFDAASAWVVGLLEENVDFAGLVARQDSDKAVLNRHYMRAHGYVPVVQEVAGGVVRIVTPDGAVLATGSGPTTRDAEDAALRKALAAIGARGGGSGGCAS